MDSRGVGKLLAPLARRVRLAVARGVIALVDDAKKLQSLQVELLTDEVRDQVERVQQYGLTSHPLKGAECIVVSVGGNRNHPVVIAVDDRRFRFKELAEGEVALYTDEGDVIHFKRDRKIEMTAGTSVKVTAPDIELVASTKLKVTSPKVEMSGELTVAGKATLTGIVFKTHTHPGVQGGPSSTGPAQ